MALLSGFDQLDPATDTFSAWLDKTNELILLVRGDTVSGQTSIMTANSQPGGSQTFGNATLFGQFSANAVVIFNDGGATANTLDGLAYGGLRGGIWDNASNTIAGDWLYVVSNTEFTNESVEVYVNSAYGLIVENTTELRYDVLFVGDGPAGSNTDAQMHWESNNNTLNLNYDVRATFGDADEYEMFYSGTKMYANTNDYDIRATANLNLITDVFELRSESNNELMITANVADGVRLYWDNDVKLTTNTHGVIVHGDTIVQDNVVVFDNNKILMGGAYPYNGAEDIATYNFQIYTDGTDGIIVSGDKDLNVKVHEGFNLTNEPGTVNFMTANADGSSEVVLYNNGTARLETTGTQTGEVPGVEVHGQANTDTLRVTEDAWFDGVGGLNSNNVHWDASANIWNYRDATKITLGDSDDWEMFYAATGRAYSNTDNMDIRARTDMNIITNTYELKSETDGELYVSANVADNSTVRLYWEGQERMSTNTHGIVVEGDVIVKDNVVIFEDNKILMGSSYPYNGAEDIATYNFQIWTDSSANASYIVEGNQDLFVRVDEGFYLQNEPGTVNFITANNDGSSEVILYNNGIARLETTGSQAGEVPGVEIHGEANTDTLRVTADANFDGIGGLNSNNVHWDAASNTWNYRDATKLTLGDSDDWEMFYTAAGRAYSNTDNQDIRARTDMNIITNTFELKSETGAELYMSANVADNSTVRLYYESVEKFQTNTNGIEVTGQVVANGGIVTYNNQAIEMGGANYAAAHNFTIVTNGTDTTLTETTNDLSIRVEDNFRVTDDTGATSLIVANTSGEVTLYHNNIAKLQTNTAGIEVYGESNTVTMRVQSDAMFDGSGGLNSNSMMWDASADTLNFNDNITASWGTGDDLKVYYTGSRANVNTDVLDVRGSVNTNIFTDRFELRSDANNELFMTANVEGAVTLYWNDSQKLQTNTNGIEVTGEVIASQGFVTYNNQRIEMGGATYGDTHNYEIYTTGTESYIRETGTGNLNIQANNLVLESTTGVDYLVGTAGGSVEITHNGNIKITTTSIGIDIEGEANTDTLRVQGNAVFEDANNVPELNWEAANRRLNYNDGVQATFGDGNDLKIYHTGAHSFIEDGGTGNLYIEGTNLILRADDGSNYFVGTDGANTTIHYGNGVKKIEVTTNGADIIGEANTTTLRVQSSAEFEAAGVDKVQWIPGSTTWRYVDSTKATFGDADDFQIYHDGSHTYLQDTAGTGNVYLDTNNLIVRNAAGNETLIDAIEDGSVRLYANNVVRVTTTLIGVDLEGEANTDTLRVQGDAQFETSGVDELNWVSASKKLNFNDEVKATFGDNDDLQIYHSNSGNTTYILESSGGNLVVEGTNLILRATDNSRYLVGNDGTSVEIYSPDDTVALTANNNQIHITDLANTSTLRVRSTSLFEDDIAIEGSTSTNTLTWDKSANTLNFGDNNFITMGANADLTMYHNGTNSFIENDTGELFVKADGLTLRSVSNEDYLTADANGAVTLFYNNSTKLATTDTGATLTGTLIADGVTVGDDEIIQLGTTLQLYNDGANSYIVETGTADLNIQANSMVLENTAGGNYVNMVAGGAVTLYHAGNAKIATASDGVDITGSLDVSTSLTVQGLTTLNGNVDLGNETTDTISYTGRVDTAIVPSANNTHDLGTNTLRWNDGFFGGEVKADIVTVEDNLSVANNVTVTNNVTANDFTGDGANITNIDANNIATGTIDDARLPNTITSDITGTAAQANNVEIISTTTDADFRVVFGANTGTYRQLYSDSTMLFNPFDDRLTVTNLTITSDIQLPTTITIAAGNFQDIEVANTATILNLEVSSLEANGVAFTGTGEIVNGTSPTVIDSFPIGQTQGYKYFVHGEDTSADSGYAVEINVIVTDNLDVFYTRYGEVESNMGDVTITPALAANNTHVDLLATCASASAVNPHTFKVLKIETRP